MPIDTVNKRRVIAGVLPVPDGSIDSFDRRHVAFIYLYKCIEIKYLFKAKDRMREFVKIPIKNEFEKTLEKDKFSRIEINKKFKRAKIKTIFGS